MRLSRSLCNHVLLISARSSLDQKSIDAQKLEIYIPKLTLTKIAQLERHETVTKATKVLGSQIQSLFEVTVFAEFVLL